MGLKFQSVRSLAGLAQTDFSPRRILTVGRLNLYLHRREKAELSRLLATSHPAAADFLSRADFGTFVDAFISNLWPEATIESLDYSSYEGAQVIHDLNEPIPHELESYADLVIEAGTLEHIFRVSEAIRTLMLLCRPQGYLMVCGPCNNLAGHGFYQFSPELLYRVFSTDNGFRVLRCNLEEYDYPGTELTPVRRVYSPMDPAHVRDRVRLQTTRPIEISVVAQRLSSTVPFSLGLPLQSDYVTTWSESVSPKRVDARGSLLTYLKASIWRLLPGLQRRVDGVRIRQRARLENARLFRRER